MTSSQRLAQLPSGSRYELLVKLASGGMATVYVGRLRRAVGFERLVAIKRAHAHLVEDMAARKVMLAEARLASQIHHPNVVAVQDVEELEGELLLVMDYVEGGALSDLLTAAAQLARPLEPGVVVRIALDACAGLDAAHRLVDAQGRPLHLIHRDVSPQNILVGEDGIARIVDFGIAKSTQSGTATGTDVLKGKLAYMAPEYIERGQLDVRGDVFALGVVIWEAFANQRLFKGASEPDTMRRVLTAPAPRISSVAPWLGQELDAVLTRALEKNPEARFSTAAALAEALEEAARRSGTIAGHAAVGQTVRTFVGPLLEDRKARVRAVLSPSDEETLAGGPGPDLLDELTSPSTGAGLRAAPLPGGGPAPWVPSPPTAELPAPAFPQPAFPQPAFQAGVAGTYGPHGPQAGASSTSGMLPAVGADFSSRTNPSAGAPGAFGPPPAPAPLGMHEASTLGGSDVSLRRSALLGDRLVAARRRGRLVVPTVATLLTLGAAGLWLVPRPAPVPVASSVRDATARATEAALAGAKPAPEAPRAPRPAQNSARSSAQDPAEETRGASAQAPSAVPFALAAPPAPPRPRRLRPSATPTAPPPPALPANPYGSKPAPKRR